MIKLAILNNSGNVGKTTICDNLFRQRIPHSEVIKIETINHDNTNDEKLSAKDIHHVLQMISGAENAIIDVGASNIELLMSGLRSMDDAHEDIDFFFIPTTPNHKQQKDTIETISGLIKLGVEPDCIKIIFNMFDPDYTLEKLYPLIFDCAYAKMIEIKKDYNHFIIEETPLFNLLSDTNSMFYDAINDNNNYQSLIRASKDREERMKLSSKRTVQKMAKKFNSKLDDTFNKISKTCNFELEENAVC